MGILLILALVAPLFPWITPKEKGQLGLVEILKLNKTTREQLTLMDEKLAAHASKQAARFQLLQKLNSVITSLHAACYPASLKPPLLKSLSSLGEALTKTQNLVYQFNRSASMLFISTNPISSFKIGSFSRLKRVSPCSFPGPMRFKHLDQTDFLQIRQRHPKLDFFAGVDIYKSPSNRSHWHFSHPKVGPPQ